MTRGLLVFALAACSSPVPRPTPLAAVASAPADAGLDAGPDAAAPRAAVAPLVPSPGRTVVVTSSDVCGLMFDSVYFPSGSAMPAPHQLPVIDATATMLVCLQKQGSVLLVEIAGHTDAREPDPTTLSASRASVVTNELVKRGVPASWLQPEGYGASQPRDRRTTDDARARNRRVELVVIRNNPPP